MPDAINQNTYVWTDTGTKPTQGDESYVAGDQPIAEYDNWAMWAVTDDIDTLNDKLGNHNSYHEVGGQDEINLVDLNVGSTVQFSEPSVGVFDIQSTDGVSVATYDDSSGAWTEFPDIDTPILLKEDVTFGGGRKILIEEDSGTQVLSDMSVTGSVSAGVEQSYGFLVDGIEVGRVYAESDGAGGTQNHAFQFSKPVEFQTAEDFTLGADLVATDGEVIWSESNGYILQSRLQNDSLTVAGGNAISGGSVSLGGSVTVSVVGDSIQENELDLSITPTWTGSHTFDNGFELGSNDYMEMAEDDGPTTVVNMPVSSTPTAGTEESLIFRVDSDQMLKLYSEANGSGNLQNEEIRSFVPFNVNSNNIVDDGAVIWDTSAQHIEQTALENDSVTITAGDGLKGGGTISLGDSYTINVEPADFSGAFLSDDGSDDLQVNIGSGLKDNSSGSITVEPVDFAGNGLTDDGSDNLAIASNSIQTNELDESIAPTWTGVHTFQDPTYMEHALVIQRTSGANQLKFNRSDASATWDIRHQSDGVLNLTRSSGGQTLSFETDGDMGYSGGDVNVDQVVRADDGMLQGDTLESGDTLTIAADESMVVGGSYTIDGDATIDGDLVTVANRQSHDTLEDVSPTDHLEVVKEVQITAVSGSKPAFDGTLSHVFDEELSAWDVTVQPTNGKNDTYGFNYDVERHWNNGSWDAPMTVNWGDDPGSDLELTVRIHRRA